MNKRPKPPTWTRQELTDEVIRLLRERDSEWEDDVKYLLSFFTGVDLEGIIQHLKAKQ